VLEGQSPVTPDTALRFGTWLGNGPELWLNLQQAYELWHARARLGAALGRIKPMLSNVT
jgi:addiction module HigA family antidote